MAHVIIAHAPDAGDAPIAVRAAIDAAGFATWWDADLEGLFAYPAYFESVLRDAWAVIVIGTPEAGRSVALTALWAYALGAGIAVIPLAVADAERLPPLVARDPVAVSDSAAWLARLRTISADVSVRAIPIPEDDVPALFDARMLLDSLSTITRASGIGLLASHDHPAARDLLIAAAGHPIYADVRRGALHALGDLGDLAAITALIARLSDSDDSVTQAAIAALVRIGERAIPALGAAVSDGERMQRRGAVLALAQIASDATVPALIAALAVPDWLVARTAAVRLGQLGDPRAIAALQVAQTSADDRLRALAGRALEQIAASPR